jgi:hypothetical protein
MTSVLTVAITGPRRVIVQFEKPGLAAPVHCIVIPRPCNRRQLVYSSDPAYYRKEINYEMGKN